VHERRPTLDEIRAMMMGDSPILAAQRRRFRHLPSDPRCKLCLVPFRGVGALAMKPLGFAQSAGNPSMCNKCINQLREQGVTGVEIPASLVFSDVRGSTALGERMTPGDFHTFMGHFYDVATNTILKHDGLVDKIVGDEVIGLFFGGVSGSAIADVSAIGGTMIPQMVKRGFDRDFAVNVSITAALVALLVPPSHISTSFHSLIQSILLLMVKPSLFHRLISHAPLL